MRDWFESATGFLRVVEDRKLVIIIAASLAMSFVLWQPLFQAKFWIVDDHQIITTLGPSKSFGVADIPEAVLGGEVGQPFVAQRFRPSYIVLRVLETYLWRDNATAWFVTRMALYGLCFAITCYVLSYFIGAIPALAFAGFEFSRPYWSDIFGRLGPSEAYAAAGLALAALGFLVRIDRERVRLACIYICIGVVLAAGSKENFLFLIVPLTWVVWRDWERLGWLTRSIYVLTALYTLFVLSSILVGTLAAGQDIYARSTNLITRARMARSTLLQPEILLWVLGIAVFWLRASGMMRALDRHTSASIDARRAAIAALWLSALLLVYVVQQFYYAGHVGSSVEGRYIFASALSQHLAALVPFAVFIDDIRLHARASPPKTVFASLVVFAVWLAISASGAKAIRTNSVNMTIKTIDFQAKVEKAVSMVKANPGVRLAFVAHNVWDFEPLVAVQKWFRFEGVENPISVVISADVATSATSAMDRYLARELFVREKEGGDGFVPWTPADANGCISLPFSADHSDVGCTDGPRIW